MSDADMIDAAFASDEQVADLTSTLEQVRAELTRSEVEHESALNELHLQLASLEEARTLGEQKLAKAEGESGAKDGEIARLREEVQRLKGASEESTGRDGQLKARVAELEREKRDLVTVIEEHQVDKEEVQGPSRLYHLLQQQQLMEPCRGRTADLNGARETLKTQSASLRDLEKQLASQSESERSARLRLQQLTLELELADTSRKFFEEELEKGRTSWQGARTDSVRRLASHEARASLMQRAHRRTAQ